MCHGHWAVCCASGTSTYDLVWKRHQLCWCWQRVGSVFREPWSRQGSANAASKGIKWKFNPPSAPHHGGVWECLVQSCKRLFYKLLGNRRLTDEVLRTTYCLAEQFLNSRPLTAASSDPKDLDALTPSHFLFGGPSAASLFHVPEEDQPDDHRQRYRKSIAYANAIWHRCLTEYAPTFKVRSKWNRQDPTTLKTGDLVWIVETTSPRGFYPLARVN